MSEQQQDFLKVARERGISARDFPDMKDKEEVHELGITITALLDRLSDNKKEFDSELRGLRKRVDKAENRLSWMRRRNLGFTFLVVLGVLGVAAGASYFGVEAYKAVNEISAREAETQEDERALKREEYADKKETQKKNQDNARELEKEKLRLEHEEALEKIRVDDKFRRDNQPTCKDFREEVQESIDLSQKALNSSKETLKVIDTMCPAPVEETKNGTGTDQPAPQGG